MYTSIHYFLRKHLIAIKHHSLFQVTKKQRQRQLKKKNEGDSPCPQEAHSKREKGKTHTNRLLRGCKRRYTRDQPNPVLREKERLPEISNAPISKDATDSQGEKNSHSRQRRLEQAGKNEATNNAVLSD